MFKKIGIPALGLFALMVAVSAPRANAAVRFGISVGGPVYRASVAVYSQPYSYVDPYYAAPAYDYGYVAPTPLYSYPYGYYGRGYGYGFRDHVHYDRDYRREYRGHEYREHEYREREGGRYRR